MVYLRNGRFREKISVQLLYMFMFFDGSLHIERRSVPFNFICATFAFVCCVLTLTHSEMTDINTEAYKTITKRSLLYGLDCFV